MNYGLTEYGEIFIFEGGGGTGGITYYAGTGLVLNGHTFSIDLVAGTGISISGNTIYATGGTSYTAGDGIDITSGTISTAIEVNGTTASVASVAAEGGVAVSLNDGQLVIFGAYTAGGGISAGDLAYGFLAVDVDNTSITVNATGALEAHLSLVIGGTTTSVVELVAGSNTTISESGGTVTFSAIGTQTVELTAGTSGVETIALCPGTITKISGEITDLQLSYSATSPDTPVGTIDSRDCGVIFTTGSTTSNISGSFINWTSGKNLLTGELSETPEANKIYCLVISNGLLMVKKFDAITV